MAHVVVERVFDNAGSFAELRAREDAVAWCLSTQRVRFLRAFLSLDKQHMVCVYDAPDAEAVRGTQRAAGLPVSHLWSATPVVDERVEAPPQGYSLVVAQRALPEGVTLEYVQYQASDPTGCGKRLRLLHFNTLLSLDCSRMCCMYYSPDLESVRVANREVGAPIERLWSAELIETPA
jgi:hypothetical protein